MKSHLSYKLISLMVLVTMLLTIGGSVLAQGNNPPPIPAQFGQNPLEGVEPDEIDFAPDPEEGIEPDEIDFDGDPTPDPNMPQNNQNTPPPFLDVNGNNLQIPQQGMMMNMGFVPAGDGCEDAAPSYLEPDMLVITTRDVAFGQVIGGQNVSYQSLLDFFATVFDGLKPHTVGSAPAAADGQTFPEGTMFTITGNHVCQPYLGGIAMYWQVALQTDPGVTGWLVENLHWDNAILAGFKGGVFVASGDVNGDGADNASDEGDPIKYGPVITIKPKGFETAQLIQFLPDGPIFEPDAFDTPNEPITPDLDVAPNLQLSMLEAYFLKPFAGVPNPGLGGTEVSNGINGCPHAAPSFLGVGHDAYFEGRYDVESPLVVPEAWQDYVTPPNPVTSLNAVMSAARPNENDTPIMPDSITNANGWGLPSIILGQGDVQAICELLSDYDEEMGGEGYDCSDIDPNNPTPVGGFMNVQIPIGASVKINEGPLCLTREHPNVDHVGVWWNVDISAYGQTLPDVWLPESMTAVIKSFELQPYPELGIYHFYLLTPETFVDLLPDSLRPNPLSPVHLGPTTIGGIPQIPLSLETEDCDDLLPSRLAAGDHLYPYTELNMRETPNGEVIGKVGSNRTFIAIGDPICKDGFRWIEVESLQGEREGWLAENDEGFYYVIPGWAPRPTEAAPPPPPPSTPDPQQPADGGSAPPPPPPPSGDNGSAPPPQATDTPPPPPAPTDTPVPPRPTEVCTPVAGGPPTCP